ncbi:MAG: 2-C-methyl-D-erythritol 4-phosphate cytidylyltransferase [Candidatus Micrarchaeia archaeon]
MTETQTLPKQEKKHLKKGVSIIIPAGGKGTRFGEDKQLFELNKKPIVQRTIEVFANLPLVDQIIVVTNEERKEQILSWDINFNLDFAIDGKERYNSVYNGLREVKYAVVGIHDGVRCLVTEKIIMDCLMCILNNDADAVFPAIKPVDTIRAIVGENKYFTPDRNTLLAVQTPQVFKTEIILDLFNKFFENPTNITDDISLVELYGKEYVITHVLGDPSNIKITTPFDIQIAETILKKRGELIE